MKLLEVNMVKASLLITATYLICFSVVSASDLGDVTDSIVHDSGHLDTRGVVQLDENNRQLVPVPEGRAAVAQQLTIEQIRESLGLNRLESAVEAGRKEIIKLHTRVEEQAQTISMLTDDNASMRTEVIGLQETNAMQKWKVDKLELEASAANTSQREQMLKEYVLWIEYESLYKNGILAMQNEKDESDRFISALKREERNACQKLPPHCHSRVRIMQGGRLVPSIAAGLEDLFEKFLNMRLVYRPNLDNDIGMVEIPFSSLTNTLTGTFNLAQCDEAGKYLSISTGYRKSKKTANTDKVEIWISPRFFVEKELGHIQYYQHMMKQWDQEFLAGVFFTFGDWGEQHVFYGNISGKIGYPSTMRDVFINSAEFNQHKYDGSWLPAKIAYKLSGKVPRLFPSTNGCFPPLEKEYTGRDVCVGYKKETRVEKCSDSSCKKITIQIAPIRFKVEDEETFHTHTKVVDVPVYEWKEYDTQKEKQEKLNELLAARGAYHYIQHFSLYI
jgi:hypothetical protein